MTAERPMCQDGVAGGAAADFELKTPKFNLKLL
jgi:hypothetical protein